MYKRQVRDLVGHAGRSFVTVSDYLASGAGRAVELDHAFDYGRALALVAADPTAVTERGRSAGRALGDDPVSALQTLFEQATADIAAHGDDAPCATLAGVMRLADFSIAFPALLTAIMLTAIYGPGLVTSIVAIGIFNIPEFARITRASANAVWTREFVLAARACGKGAWRITLEHVLPNIASVLIVQATIRFAIAILAEAALSYLGLGTQPPTPSWGRMLNEGQSMMYQAPLLAVWPGLAIVLSVLGLNLMGDGLRDLLDPRLARQR